jgi:hypothetical protein
MNRGICRPGLIFAVALFAAYSLLAWGVANRKMIPTGDEPHYLIVSHSIVVDHDISMVNNYRALDYKLFYPHRLLKRTTFSGDRKREIPAYGLGVSVFLSPFYWLALTFFPGQLVLFLRLVMCGVTALAAYHLAALACSMSVPGRWRTVLLCGVFLASPVVTYSNQMYPEIVAFLLVVLALRQFHALQSGERGWPLMWLSLISPVLIWLHPKYLALSLLVFTVSLYLAGTRRTASRGQAVVQRVLHIVITVGGIAFFFLFLHAEYGSWSPNRIYGGAQVHTSLLDLLRREGPERVWIMLRMLLAYWIDQRFGIFVYAPIYAAFLPAVLHTVRRHRRYLFPALLLFAAHFLLLSWGAQMGGFAPPSRHFVVLIPLMVLPILTLSREWNATQKALCLLLQSLAWTIAFLMFSHYRSIFTNATWRNPDGTSEFWSALRLERAIPQLTTSHPDWFVTIAWCCAILLLAALLFPRPRPVLAGESTDQPRP